MNSIGGLLRETRSKKSLTLEEVHAKTKIHPRVLQLLEEEKFDRLPSPIYVKSFLRSYAEFLEINPESLIDTYEREKRKDPEQTIYIAPAEERDRGRSALDLSWVAPALTLLILAALVAGAVGGVRHLMKARPASGERAAAQTVKKSAEAKPKPAKAAESKNDVSPAPAAQDPSWILSAEQKTFPSISPRSTIQLKIEALETVWLRVTCDGKVLFQSMLKKGAVESWVADKEIHLWTGNAANMALEVNRQKLGSPGKGLTKKMILTREGIRNDA